MRTSAKGVAALEQEEGVVLRAYRDVVGVLTIGAGLTAASGVIKPKVGMVITRAEATALLQKALSSTYEPAVEMAMTRTDKMLVERPLQHEFDAGVSFHWNCGTIRKATWVKLWKARVAPNTIRASLFQWNKGGGKVIPGLVHRREREAAMLLDGVYPFLARQPEASVLSAHAKWGLAMTGEAIEALRDGLRVLGYDPGRIVNAVEASAVRKFQADHGLTVDAIIGRATLSTLQRRLDARSKAKAPLLATSVAAPVAATDWADQVAGLPYAAPVAAGLAALWLVSLAYRYRDAIAGEINPLSPRLAALLRSF
jgi:lysozyme